MIYDDLKSQHELYAATAKIEARIELVKELKSIIRPSKQVQELIKKYEQHDSSK